MGIFKQIEGPLKRVLSDLFADKDLRSLLTYKVYVKRAWSDSAGANVATFTPSDLVAIRLRHTDNSKLVGMANIQVGDQLYLFQYEDCPDGMSLKDEIVDEFDNVQEIKDITNIFNLAVAVTVGGGTSAIGS